MQYINQGTAKLDLVPGTLIYSDDPETVSGFGRLYRGQVATGLARVYLYHVNNTGQAAKITAVIKNPGTEPALVEFGKRSLPTPSGNYILVGKTGVKNYFEFAGPVDTATIPPGGAVLLNGGLDTTTVNNGQLLAGIFDFRTNQPVEVTTLILPASTNTLAAYNSAGQLAGDNYNRQGTFPAIGKNNENPYSYTTTNGIRSIRIADGNVNIDPNVTGFDEERGVPTGLAGGFGLTYNIRLQVTAAAGKNVAVLLNPRGGGHGGYMRWSFPDGAAATGQLAPGSALNLGDSSKAVVCAKIAPDSSPKLLTIDYMPPGASNMPILFILVPYDAPSGVADWSVY